jgi:NAD(P)H-nitrite reductase large subunit
MKHLVIIGNGITGITVARSVRKMSEMKITVISGETDHLFSRTALMYIYMGHMKFEHTKPYEDWFWPMNRINLIRGLVNEIDTDNKRLTMDDSSTIDYDVLVIDTGSQSNKFGWPGQNLPGVQGLYSYQDLELLEENSKDISRAVIVGGGLIGIELSEMLLSRAIAVTFLVREEYYWNVVLPKEEAKLVSQYIVEHGIDLRLSTELKEITAGEDGRVNSVITNKDEKIPCQLVGLTVGVHPNIEVVKKSQVGTGRGILVNEYMETNIPDVYAAGDCAEIKTSEEGQHNRIEQLWYTGRMQAESLAKTICGERTKYDRDIWFNSAKFFDVEYQTYGFVSNIHRAGEKSLYWQSENGKNSIRIVYKEDTYAVVGFNLFGIRFRHKICEKWIREGKSVDFVLEHLSEANFDPEFFKGYESKIVKAFPQ